MNPQSIAYAATQLRQNDRDRYFATLVLEPREREALTALYAFSTDVASIRERAKEPAAGEIRLQWWADALIGQGHGNVRQNPLADALLDVVAAYGLPIPPLSRLVDARRFDLYQDPMPDLPTFEGYAGETVSALYQLGAMILNGGRPVETGDAAGHLGVAHALIGHLRALGYNASQGRIFLPADVFDVCGVSDTDILTGRSSEGLAIALTRIVEIAADHLRRADRAIRELPRSLRSVFAPIAVLQVQLKQVDIEAPFHPPVETADWRKLALLTWWKFRNA